MDKLNKKVKLSFIIPAYNCENYLRKCVESIIQQNIKSYEILIINDGSTDATLDIALQLEKEYIDYVKVYSQTNNGAAAARNSGLRLSSGEYIVFVDSDDMIYGNSLDKCISKMEENNVDILLSNMSIYVNDKIKINEAGFENVVINNEILKYVSCLQKFPGSSCSKIIKKEFLLNNNLEFREKIVNEDIDFMIKCFKKAKKIYHSNSSWYMYRQNVQGSVTNTISPKSCEDMFIVINDTINNANESNLLYINRILCYEYSTLFFYYARLKNEDKEKLKKLFRANRNLLLYRGIKEKIIYIFYSLFGLDYTSKLIYRVYKMKKGEKG